MRRVLAVLLLAGAASAAAAQGTGGLSVHVVDPQGQALPGATVRLSHEAGNLAPTETATDAEGRAEFPVLRPGGGYVVHVSRPGFAARQQTGLRVPIGEVARLRVELGAEIEERVQSVVRAPVVELERSASTTRFDDQFVDDLPVPGRFYQNVLTIAPGVQDPDDDGNPSVHGSRSRDFRAEVSGVSNVDPLTGQYMALVNADSIEEIEIVTAGAGVEFGRAQGGFARIVQKQGTNEFEGTFGMLFRSSVLDGTGAGSYSNLPAPEFEELHPTLQLSGPLVRDRLWYRLSHEHLHQEDPINVVGGIVVQEREQGIHADQLTWQASPRNKLALQYQSDPLRVDQLGISSKTTADSTQTLDTGTESWSLIWTAPASSRLLVETTAAWQELRQDLAPTAAGVRNTCFDGPDHLELARCTNFETGTVSGSHHVTVGASSERFTLRSQATWFAGTAGGMTHQLKLGLSVENERYFRDLEQRPEVGYFIFRPADSPLTEIPTVVTTVSVPTTSRTRATGANWAAYVEDQIKPAANLSLTIGLRVDGEDVTASGQSDFDPAAEGARYLAALGTGNTPPPVSLLQNSFTAYEALDAFIVDVSRTLGIPSQQLLSSLPPVTLQSTFWRQRRQIQDIAISNVNFAPFLAAAWDPFSDGKTKLALSARRYYDKVFLAVPLIESNPAATTLLYRGAFVGTDGVSVCDTCLQGGVSPVANVESVAPDLETPYQDEWRLAFEREVAAETLLRLEYVDRAYRAQFGNTDPNHATADFGRCRVPDRVDPAVTVATPGLSDPANPATWLVDAYTGQPYPDTDPGDGDGRIDDCQGTLATLQIARPDGYDDLYTLNPGWNQIRTIGNVNRSDYSAFIVELIRRQYRGWEFQGSYRWSESRGNGEDFRQFIGLDQRLVAQEAGWDSDDQRHVVKLAATTITPWSLRVGGTLRWQSGLPYSILTQQLAYDFVPQPYRIGGFSPARVQIRYPTGSRNSERNPSQWLLDLRFAKDWRLGRAVQLQAAVEVFNVLDDGTYEIYNPDFEQGFQINGVNDARREFGRRWQLGMRLAF